jgi:hypothetical protein
MMMDPSFFFFGLVIKNLEKGFFQVPYGPPKQPLMNVHLTVMKKKGERIKGTRKLKQNGLRLIDALASGRRAERGHLQRQGRNY